MKIAQETSVISNFSAPVWRNISLHWQTQWSKSKQYMLESTVMTAMQRIGEVFYQALECGAIASDC